MSPCAAPAAQRPALPRSSHPLLQLLGVAELVRREPHVYLLPASEDAESEDAVLEDYWPHLFEALLAGWLTDERQWPPHRTRMLFTEWFDVHLYPAVEDLHLDPELIELV